MPTYPYLCNLCAAKFEVIKRVSDIEHTERCPQCDSDVTSRTIGRVNFNGASDWDKAAYDPAFGKVIRDNNHRKREAKSRGWVEVGDEPVDNLISMQDKATAKAQDDAFEKNAGGLEYGIKKAMGKV